MIRLWLAAEGWDFTGERELLAWLSREAAKESLSGEIHLILVDDAEIERLNRSYLGHEGATDVMAFPLEEGEPVTDPGEEGTSFPAGEVYVSLERAAEQAREYGVTLSEEVARLALHGVLHLAGWSDEDAADREAMRRREDEGLHRAGAADSLPWVAVPPHVKEEKE
ncbi:MAG TPA: rRNA maturation RNase YbeY [Bacteroidetes bacterium]|nr:rRNA maturation RNase YbeY [Bacteroidota bacterium]